MPTVFVRELALRAVALGGRGLSALKQRKLEAKKLLENVADSRKSTAYHPGARAGRFVGRFFGQPCSAFCKTIVFQKQHIKSVYFFN